MIDKQDSRWNNHKTTGLFPWQTFRLIETAYMSTYTHVYFPPPRSDALFTCSEVASLLRWSSAPLLSFPPLLDEAITSDVELYILTV